MEQQTIILSDLLSKYNINDNIFETLDVKTRGRNHVPGEAILFLDDNTALLFDGPINNAGLKEEVSCTKMSIHELTHSRLNSIISKYDKERSLRSLTPTNLRRRFVDRDYYSFMLSAYNDEGDKRKYKLIFRPLNAEGTIILWSNQDITHTMESDSLTGGLNRDGLLRNLQETLAAKSPDVEYAILYFNITGLRRINEYYGNETGDMILQHFYAQMAYSELQPKCYARSHSDSYYCLVQKERVNIPLIEELCCREITVGEKVIKYRLTCGIYYITDYSEPPTALMGRARLALRYVKDPLKRPWVILDEEMRKHCISDSEIVDQLDHALEHNEFVPYFQPIVNVRTERVEMAEALVRWNSSRYGFVSPADFVPSLERCGEISRVDMHMEGYIYNMQRERLSKGKNVVPVDINLSWVDFEDKNFVAQITEHLEDKVVSNDLCRYEITESTICELTDSNHTLLQAFKKNKAKLLIDDFGKGNSFGTMNEIDFTIVKIDKSMIDNIGSKKTDFLIESLINMFHKMKAKIVAEGVERLAQVDFLRSVGCDYIQGYYYYKPMPEDQFMALLDAQSQIHQPEIENQQSNSLWMERDVLEAQYAQMVQANESAKCLRLLLDEMGLHYFEWDVKTHIDICSDRFREMYGLPTNEIPNIPENSELCHPDDVARFKEFYYRAEQGEQQGIDYFRLKSPDGQGYIWYRKTFYTLFDKDNKPYKVILTMQNCVDRYSYRALTQCNNLLVTQQGITTFKYTVDDDVFEFSRVQDGQLISQRIPNYISMPANQMGLSHSKNQKALVPLLIDRIQNNWAQREGYVDYYDLATDTLMRAYYTVVENDLGGVYAVVGQAEDIIKTREKLNETIQQQHEYITVVDGLRNIYNGVSMIDLSNGESNVILADAAYSDYIDTKMNWIDSAKAYADNVIELEYKNLYNEFMDIKTLNDRIGDSKYISTEYKDRFFGWIRGFLIPSERNQDGSVKRVLFASLPIGSEKSTMDRLIYLSETDGLTRLYNRISGERYIEEALRKKRPGTFAIIDCDKFKYVNDTFGHVVGDKLLVEISAYMKQVNPDGINLRLGGDEFAMYIFGESTTTKILDLFNTLFKKIESINITSGNNNGIIHAEVLSPSVSVGAVYYSGKENQSFDALYRTADSLLYQSKMVMGCRVTL